MLLTVSLPVTASNDDLSLSVTTDLPQYRWLFQKAFITLTLKNNGNEDVTITFPSTQRFDIEIVRLKNDKVVFRWSENQVFELIVTDIVIPVNGSVSWMYDWYQRGNIFRNELPSGFNYPVLPGLFRINGKIPLLGLMYTATREIKVGPVFSPVV
jgi:hypothetical protein